MFLQAFLCICFLSCWPLATLGGYNRVSGSPIQGKTCEREMYSPVVDMETIVSLCKRRGFIFQSSEIYGGLGSTWDYGPLGVELKRNVKEAWWQAVVRERDDMVGLDAAILMHPDVWEASGHVTNFTDPLVDCKNCKQRFRADHLLEGYFQKEHSLSLDDVKVKVAAENPGAAAAGHLEMLQSAFKILNGRSFEWGKFKCPECEGPLTEPRNFNLMFKTFMGPVEDAAAIVWMRPETAQGIFVNFRNVQQTTRKKLPFGIAQVGKAFRNEITPGNFTFRTREFEQMEIEYFVIPGTDEEWHKKWIAERRAWYERFGIKGENLRLREHDPDELAHYAKGCVDVEYKFPIGWSELEGIANRTDYDLTQHATHSGRNMCYFDDATSEEIMPYVIEPSAGADRSTLAFLVDAYEEEQLEKDKRVVLHFHRQLAPIKAAVLPLARNKPEIVEVARKLAADMRLSFSAMYDDTGSIGKLYRRQDEVGTLWCVTVDHQSLEDNMVTVRDRDTMRQERVPIAGVKQMLKDRLEA